MSAERHVPSPPTCQICGRTSKQVQLVPAAVVRPFVAERIARDHPSWSSDGCICIDDLNRFRSDYVQSLLRDERGEVTSLQRSVVESLARVLRTHGAWVTEYLPESRRLRALAFWLGGEWIRDFEHLIDGTPCEDVVTGRRLVHIADNVLAYVGCIAGAIPFDEYRRGLIDAGFAEVEIVDTGADLNAYAKVENQTSCCASSPRAGAPSSTGCLPMLEQASGGCSTSADGDTKSLLHRLADLLRQYDVNDYAASVRVFATMPT